jgi:hypothetical protein
MTRSLAPRFCLVLAAASLGGCFDPAPNLESDDDDGGSATSGTDPTASGTSGDPSGGGTADDPSAGTAGASAGGPDATTDGETSDGETTDDSSDTTEGDDESSSGDDGSSSGGEVDADAPSVSSMTPSAGTSGVLEDAVVQLVFSEPMDTDSVELALDASDLEPFSISWNDEGTTLTLTPDNGLAYATGNSPINTEANEFGVSVSTDATDLAGNTLDESWFASFSTARRITVELAHDPGYTGGVVSSGVLQTGSGDDPIVGDHNDNLARRGFIGFSITPLPAGILAVEDAELRADQWLTLGDPMPSLGTAVTIAHIAPESLPGGAYASTPLASLGVFSDEDSGSADNTKTMDVTDNVQFDYDAGESHTQYRLSLATATNFNSTTDRVRYNDEVLEVTYLMP